MLPVMGPDLGHELLLGRFARFEDAVIVADVTTAKYEHCLPSVRGGGKSPRSWNGRIISERRGPSLMPCWDPQDYGRNARAQATWADEVIPLLELAGDEVLLDLGSGDGRVTAAIAGRIPEGHVVGLDASPAMVIHARAKYGRRPTLEFVLADMQAIPFRAGFDRIFSNAALHWAPGQGRILNGIARALRPGGRAVLQMGGAGNAAPILRVLEDLIASDRWKPFFPKQGLRYAFLDGKTYRDLLAGAGLEPVEVSMYPKTMVQQGRDGLAGWVRTTWLLYTEDVPVEQRDAFIDAIVDGYLADHPPEPDGTVRVPMVRLQIVAVRP